MSVDDHGIETLKKAAEQVTPGDKSNYYLKTVSLSAFQIPKDADAFTVELGGGGLNVIYKFRGGGVAGAVLATITLTYSSVQTLDLTQGVFS